MKSHSRFNARFCVAADNAAKTADDRFLKFTSKDVKYAISYTRLRNVEVVFYTKKLFKKTFKDLPRV